MSLVAVQDDPREKGGSGRRPRQLVTVVGVGVPGPDRDSRGLSSDGARLTASDLKVLDVLWSAADGLQVSYLFQEHFYLVRAVQVRYRVDVPARLRLHGTMLCTPHTTRRRHP